MAKLQIWWRRQYYKISEVVKILNYLVEISKLQNWWRCQNHLIKKRCQTSTVVSFHLQVQINGTRTF